MTDSQRSHVLCQTLVLACICDTCWQVRQEHNSARELWGKISSLLKWETDSSMEKAILTLADVLQD